MSAPRVINIGDVFTYDLLRDVSWTCERLPDDEVGRPRIRTISCSLDADLRAMEFTTEPEWFRQRGLEMGRQAAFAFEASA